MLGSFRFLVAQSLAALAVALLCAGCSEGACATHGSSQHVEITALGQDAGSLCSLVGVTFDYYPASGCPVRGLHDLDFAGRGLTAACAAKLGIHVGSILTPNVGQPMGGTVEYYTDSPQDYEFCSAPPCDGGAD